MRYLIIIISTLSLQALAAPCGNEGSIDERIRDCQQSCTASTTRNTFNWSLVTRTIRGHFEIWRDDSSGLLWSQKAPRWGTKDDALYSCEENDFQPFKSDLLFWQLPDRWDFRIALSHGLFECTPDSYETYWTNDYNGPDRGYVYNGIIREFQAVSTHDLYDYRCIRHGL